MTIRNLVLEKTFLHLHLSFNLGGHMDTTDDFATCFPHFSLFSVALWDLANSRPINLILFSHLFSCLPGLLPPVTVPSKMGLTRLDERETCPYHFRFSLITMVRWSSCGPIARWILAPASLLVAWSLYEICSILPSHFRGSYILLCSSAVKIHDSQA